MDEEKPATPEEEAAAAALAEALDGKLDGADPGDAVAIGLIRAAAGKEAPLGELRARGIARAAVEEAKRRSLAPVEKPARRRVRSWTAGGFLAVAAAAALAVFLGARGMRSAPELPVELSSRTAGMLVPGPFPDEQTAAQRLDAVTADRLVALREVRLRAVAQGRRR
jgi:hypothetical protein